MSSSNESSNNDSASDPQAAGGEQEHAGNSGEGAASALAHLKTQVRQHRHQIGDSEDQSGGHA
jgi:hypothetical protein